MRRAATPSRIGLPGGRPSSGDQGEAHDASAGRGRRRGRVGGRADGARWNLFERVVMADYDEGRAQRAIAGGGDRFAAYQLDARDEQAIAELIKSRAVRRRAERGRPAVRDAGLPRGPRRRGHLPRHGDVAVPPAPVRAVPADGGQAGRRAVRAGRRMGAPRAAGAVRHRGRARPVRRVRPLRGGPAVLVDRRGGRPRRRQPGGRGLRVRPDVLHLDDDRGVPEPAGHVGARHAGGSPPSRSASRRRSSSRPASGRSSASTWSTKRCCSCRAGSTPTG